MSDIPSRALRETLRDQLASPSSSGCIDADMLAAWSDGTLSARERATVESHAAACARCQALMAALAKTEAPLPSRKWWQASTVRWLVPIGAVSVLTVAVWMNTPAPRLTAPASSSTPLLETPRADTESRQAKTTPALEGSTTSKRTDSTAAKTREGSTPIEKKEVAPVPPSAPSPVAAEAAPIFAPAAAPPVQPSLQAEAPQRVQPQAAAPAQPPTEAQSDAFRLRSSSNLTVMRDQAIAGVSAAREILSPDQNVRWRIVAGNSVQRSIDGGATWQSQSTGSIQQLTAGAAPSATICWLVGRAGTVLVSKDGQSWLRAPFPEAIDLTAIVATDGSSATVTSADGRTFKTSDGGATWQAGQNR